MQKKATLKVVFSVKDHFMLNSGLPAYLQGKEVSINLNQPVYVSEIIGQCRKMGVAFGHIGYKCVDGVEILKQIGYIFK